MVAISYREELACHSMIIVAVFSATAKVHFAEDVAINKPG